MKKYVAVSFAALLVTACGTSGTPVPGSTPAPMNAEAEQTTSSPRPVVEKPSGIAAFEPTPTVQTRVDYTVWDDALNYMVLDMGSSLRQRAGRPDPEVGTRFVVGHESPFRLEGNKIFYSLLDDEILESVSEYRASLEEIANQISIPDLSRNEQLAFWYNLHNVIVIDEIGKAYPVERPNRIKPDGSDLMLDDAPVITIDGVDLSLRDIREGIVYSYWDDPLVIYGFFHGDLGSPAITREAFNSRNISRLLKRNAREFVNSLRGVYDGRSTVYVSQIYEEAGPYFFPDFESDLRAHLGDYAGEEVEEILTEKPEMRFAQYEDRIADLSGGEIRSTNLNVLSSDEITGTGGPSVQVSPQVARMLREYREKLQRRRERGGFRTTVTVIDLPDSAGGSEEID